MPNGMLLLIYRFSLQNGRNFMCYYEAANRNKANKETWNNGEIKYPEDTESDRILNKDQQIHLRKENRNIYLDNGNKQEYL